MRAFIDHTSCPEWLPAQERCLGSFILDPEHVPPRSCFLKVEDDGRPELTLIIYERGRTKVLVITDRNRGRAADGFELMPDMTLRAMREGLITRREIEEGWRHHA